HKSPTPHRVLRLYLCSLAESFLSRRSPTKTRAGIRQPDAQLDRNQWLLLLASATQQLSKVVRADARQLCLLGERRPVHHPHAPAERNRAAAGELFCFRNSGIERKARSDPLAVPAALQVGHGEVRPLLQA